MTWHWKLPPFDKVASQSCWCAPELFRLAHEHNVPIRRQPFDNVIEVLKKSIDIGGVLFVSVPAFGFWSAMAKALNKSSRDAMPEPSISMTATFWFRNSCSVSSTSAESRKWTEIWRGSAIKSRNSCVFMACQAYLLQTGVSTHGPDKWLFRPVSIPSLPATHENILGISNDCSPRWHIPPSAHLTNRIPWT